MLPLKTPLHAKWTRYQLYSEYEAACFQTPAQSGRLLAAEGAAHVHQLPAVNSVCDIHVISCSSCRSVLSRSGGRRRQRRCRRQRVTRRVDRQHGQRDANVQQRSITSSRRVQLLQQRRRHRRRCDGDDVTVRRHVVRRRDYVSRCTAV